MIRGAIRRPAQRPVWLQQHLPGLDGLRGIAIAIVVMFHCTTELGEIHLAWFSKWGWTGVNLFFVLSGFLITGIILDQRHDPHFFRSFYARRGLRIWPLYALLLPVTYFVFGPANMWDIPSRLWLTHNGVPWLIFLAFAQNLTRGLSGTIFPTWSLAIEEQFYLLWAPLARFIRPKLLIVALVGVLAFEPWCRARFGPALTSVNTLYKLDGLAVGCLIAIAMRASSWSAAVWRWVAWGAIAVGLMGWEYGLIQGGPFFDTTLAIGFGGMLLLAVTATGRAGLYQRALESRPLSYLGRISYGLYLIHMPVFAELGGLDIRMRTHGAWGAIVILAVRWTASLLVASLSWFCFEKPILRLKRFFRPAPRPAGAAAAAP